MMRAEIAAFFYGLAARLEKKHEEAVVRYNTKHWPGSHTGKSAITTKKEDLV